MSNQLRWRRDPPTEPGWYWVRHLVGGTAANVVVHVTKERPQGAVAWALIAWSGREKIGFTPVSWAGPLPLPLEPQPADVEE